MDFNASLQRVRFHINAGREMDLVWRTSRVWETVQFQHHRIPGSQFRCQQWVRIVMHASDMDISTSRVAAKKQVTFDQEKVERARFREMCHAAATVPNSRSFFGANALATIID